MAIDFYDGSIMYDFDEKKTVICDIDFYSKMPYTNNMGRMWGSSRFMSLEEFELGATIDEITNVYLMGATAFAFFADYNRTLKKWQLGKELFKVALKAVSNERSQRQQSIQLGNADDLNDIAVAVQIAKWYKELHGKGKSFVSSYKGSLYDETDVITKANIDFIKCKTSTESNPVWEVLFHNFNFIRKVLQRPKELLLAMISIILT